MSCTVAVDELSVGMYIHLDGGWLSHPFALSSFRISSAEQIATLRALGLSRVRWAPEKSDASSGGDAGGEAGPDPEAAPQVGANAASPAAQGRRRKLIDQREALLRCERQHGEAAQAWREAGEALAERPQQAGRRAEALTQALLSKMLVSDEVGLRLIDSRDDHAATHALNVGVVSLLVGRALGLSGDELLDLGVGALMHDVGKQDMAERFRHAHEDGRPAETAIYREHVARGLAHGHRMSLSPGALTVLAQHHEHADGSGFPLRLAGEQMSPAARIVAVVNRFDNLCNPASRTVALTPHEAVATLFAHGRSRLDTAALNAFIRVVGVYPAGSLVQLTDDRYAMVVAVNSSRPLKPRVLVHDPDTPRDEAVVIELERARDVGIRRSLPAARMPASALAYLDPQPRVSYYFEPLARTAEDEGRAA